MRGWWKGSGPCRGFTCEYLVINFTKMLVDHDIFRTPVPGDTTTEFNLKKIILSRKINWNKIIKSTKLAGSSENFLKVTC